METNEQVLALIYKIREGQVYEVTPYNSVIMKVKQDHFLQRMFRKLGKRIPEYKGTELDALGSFVVLQLDGQRTVGEVGELVEEKFGEDAHPLYERLLLFLNHIHINENYISLVETTIED